MKISHQSSRLSTSARKTIDLVVKKAVREYGEALRLLGNDDSWEEVVDFTKLRRGGVRLQELLGRQ